MFLRSPTTQAITQIQCVPQTLTKSGLCSQGSGAPALEGDQGIAVSPDGKFLYTTGYFSGAVVGFNILQSGSEAGKIGNPVNCLWTQATNFECVQTAGMISPSAIALSPDGRDAYVASFNGGITVLSRDPVSGVLSFSQCYTQAGGGECAADPALVVGARDVVVSPGGRYVYLSGGSGSNGYLRAYARDTLTGQLTPLGCLTYLAIAGCTTAAGLANAEQLAISPDGRNLYLSSYEGGDNNGAVAAFAIQTAPNCQSTSVTVTSPSSVSVPLLCTDESGDAITRSVPSNPSHGTLGAIDQSAGTVTYTPAAGFGGIDSFTFQASDGTNASTPASVSIAVNPATVVQIKGPPPIPGPRSRILGALRPCAPPS